MIAPVDAAAALARAAAGELLDAGDLAAIFRLSVGYVRRRSAVGDFDVFLVKPVIGPRRYSGVLVHRAITGAAVYTPTFGRRRA